jgi:nucleoside-diphosphate-sugar epimerase
MRVFVTGATGFIGSAVVEELMAAGHSVTALARSEEAGKKLSARGVQPHLGNLDDRESLRRAAGAADGVIHLAYMHGLGQIPFAQRLRVILGGLPTSIVSRFLAVSAEADRRAIDTIGTALKGSGRPLVTTFGTLGLSHEGFRATKPATEEDEPDPLSPGIDRARNEEKVEALASLGVRATTVRLAPSVHGEGDTGLVPQLIGIARKRGHSGYIGDGQNRWPAVHRRDAARLFRLALEKGVAGARYHGVGEEGIPFRSIAEVIGRKLNIPVGSISAKVAAKQFSYFGGFAATDNPSSNTRTREQLGWEPTGPELLVDLNGPGYYATK